MTPRSRTKRPRAILKRWFPPVAWAGIIFLFSTERFSAPHTSRLLAFFLSWLFPSLTVQGIDLIHLLLRKFGHFGEYCIFAVLLMRALRGEEEVSARRCAVWTMAITLAYAASDELHQSFVVGRTGAVNDIMIDFLGGLCGALWMFWRYGRAK